VGHDRTIIAGAPQENKRLRSNLNEWPNDSNARVADMSSSSDASHVDLQHAEGMICAQIKNKGIGGLTICYWKPSVLFFDLELVCQS
jgi:hypothetical protein